MNEAQTLKLEAGKYYRTRDGKKAVVVYVMSDSPFNGSKPFYPATGWVDDANEYPHCWNLDGSLYEPDEESKNDIVAEWVEPKRIKGKMFVCESVSGVFGSYIGYEPRDPLGAKVIACIEIDVEEGHGLGETA